MRNLKQKLPVSELLTKMVYSLFQGLQIALYDTEYSIGVYFKIVMSNNISYSHDAFPVDRWICGKKLFISVLI